MRVTSYRGVDIVEAHWQQSSNSTAAVYQSREKDGWISLEMPLKIAI